MAFTTGGSRAQAGTSHSSGLSRRHQLMSKLYLPVLIPAFLLTLYGGLIMWSASLSIADANFARHLVGIVLGWGAACVVWRYDYRNLSNLTTILLVVAVVLMLLPKIPGLGVTAKGMTGWIEIPLIKFRFQPSEPGKIVTILLVASVAAQYNGLIPNVREYLKTCLYLIIPFVLINIVPDLGTGLIILVSGATIIIMGGAKPRWYLITIGCIVAFAAAAIILSMMPNMPHLLKDYQLNRLIVFIDPSVDPTGNGYNLTQAKIAVGSGGIFGKGISNATQVVSGFLPEAQTDFVFALLSEEFGFVGALLVLGLFAWLIFATIMLAVKTDNIFGKLCLSGIIALWTFQVLQNVGMCIGIMPITGIPLPFISYGSSSMVIQLVAVGMVQSIWRYRQKSA